MASGWWHRAAGGPARARAVLLLSAVLALNAADTGTIGAVAGSLERSLGIGHARLGLLAGVSAAVGALACVPAGILADRVGRVRLLVGTVVVWSVAMAASGFAGSYLWLLTARLALGAAVAASGPVIASLTGDLFPPEDRARTYGWILSGEVVGAGLGLLVGGDLAAATSWRYAFFLQAVASAALAFGLARGLPEPARGGRSWIPEGAPVIPLPGNDQPPAAAESATDAGRGRSAAAVVTGTGVAPDRSRVLTGPAVDMSSLPAVGYLLRIPTNRLLIVASALGYFFFAGLRTFAVVFAQRRFDMSPFLLSAVVPVIGIGALAGVLAGGRVSDAAMARGVLSARVLTPAIGFAAAAVLFAPGLLTTAAWAALPLFTAAAAALASANPPLDAARLDIVPAGLWGRAESLRTLLRLGAEAVAPTTFGLLAQAFGGGAGARGDAVGLRDAFLVMLVPLLANAAMTAWCRRSYPTDVATAAANDRGR